MNATKKLQQIDKQIKELRKKVAFYELNGDAQDMIDMFNADIADLDAMRKILTNSIKRMYE